MKNVSFLLVAFALSTAACSGAVTADGSPQTSANALTKAPIAPGSHGAVKLVGEALGEVSLRADQRDALEKLAATAETRHAGMVSSRKDLLSAFADQVEKGAIDRSALQPKIDKIAQESEKSRADDQAALVKVHDLLDANQRNELVDALHDKMKARGKEHGFGKMKELAADLKLTDDQISQIKTAMHGEHHPKGGHGEHDGAQKLHARGGKLGHDGKKLMEGFRSEKFDASSFGEHHDMSAGAGRMIGMVEKVLPILTPEQRKIAAEKIRAMQEGPF